MCCFISRQRQLNRHSFSFNLVLMTHRVHQRQHSRHVDYTSTAHLTRDDCYALVSLYAVEVQSKPLVSCCCSTVLVTLGPSGRWVGDASSSLLTRPSPPCPPPAHSHLRGSMHLGLRLGYRGSSDICTSQDGLSPTSPPPPPPSRIPPPKLPSCQHALGVFGVQGLQ